MISGVGVPVTGRALQRKLIILEVVIQRRDQITEVKLHKIVKMKPTYKAACDEIDSAAEALNSLSQEIWKNPEENFGEIHAHRVLTEFLESRGLKVEKNYILETGFRSVFGSAEDGPHVAVLCEYDALPEIGHGCGHNLIAEVGIAAGIGVHAAFKSNGKALGKVSMHSFFKMQTGF